MDSITDQKLEDEKKRLHEATGFQVLEYIRSSIEIIMNLKIEDLEKEFQNRNQFAAGDLDDSCTNISQYSVASSNLIQQSMKDALMVMNESVDS